MSVRAEVTWHFCILLKASVAPMKVRDAKALVETVASDNPYTSLQILADLSHL